MIVPGRSTTSIVRRRMICGNNNLKHNLVDVPATFGAMVCVLIVVSVILVGDEVAGVEVNSGTLQRQ